MMASRIRIRLVLAATVGLLWFMPSTASAQCFFDAGVYSDLYDNGIDFIETYGAGWDGSWCSPPVCGHTYTLQTTLWFNYAAVGYQTFELPEGIVGYSAVFPGWAAWDATFEIECSCAGAIQVGSAGGSQQVQRPFLSGPTSVQRGQNATFSIIDVPSGGSISGWTYQTAANGTVTRQSNTSSDQWAGVMVDSGTVSVSVNGVTLPSLSVTVTARSGWAWSAPAPVQRNSGFMTNCGTFSVPTTPQRTGLGVVGVGQNCPYPDYDPAELVFTSISDGPNQGFKYLMNPLFATSSANPSRFDWAISSDVDDLNSPFMLNQTGSYSDPFFTQGCVWSVTLRNNTRLHESGAGATAVNQSHYTVFKNQLENVHNLGLIAEKVVGTPQQTEAQAKVAAQSALNAAINSIEAFVSAPANEPPADWNRHPATLAFQGAVNYPNPYNQDCTP